jgi:hypothetical protein
MSRYGIDADEALHRVHALHKRHGEAIGQVVVNLLTELGLSRSLHSVESFPLDGLPALLFARGLSAREARTNSELGRAEDLDPESNLPADPSDNSQSFDQPIRVFVSYTHDSSTHKKRALDLAQRLRQDGLECMIDQFVNGSPDIGWPKWASRQIAEADFAIVVCSKAYRRRFEGKEKPGEERRGQWESLIVVQEIYEAGAINEKFIPVVFSGAGKDDLPLPLRSYTCYRLFLEYRDLYRQLTYQPKVRPDPIGALKIMPTQS